jgi:hypothetical protein
LHVGFAILHPTGVHSSDFVHCAFFTFSWVLLFFGHWPSGLTWMDVKTSFKIALPQMERKLDVQTRSNDAAACQVGITSNFN